ncbi:MAG: hypothetical protein KatS3mg099_452 [Candidatus Parcubacteria bacterium]|nr:MAG: hypothetical protein KatS3mg099_452 [Candidatus Parcubacteria bacterium]
MSVVARHTFRTRRALVALALLVVVLLPASAHAALPEPWRSLLHQPVESAVWAGDRHSLPPPLMPPHRSLASAFTTLTDTLGAALYTAFFPQPQEPQPIVRLAAAHRTDEQQPDARPTTFARAIPRTTRTTATRTTNPNPPSSSPPTRKTLRNSSPPSNRHTTPSSSPSSARRKTTTNCATKSARSSPAAPPCIQTYGAGAAYIPPLNTPGWTQRIDTLGNVTITQAVIEDNTTIRNTTLENITITNTSGTTTASLTTLTVTATTTFASHTPNAILYLSPARTLTTTPTFTFNGTNLTLGTTTPLNNAAFTLNGTFALQDLTTLPATTTNLLYATGGTLYWAGIPVASSSIGYWTTDGTNVWRPTGKVGIGTSSPSALLAVEGTAAIRDGITIGSAFAGVSPTPGDMYVAGSIGIGTTNPTEKLTVAGNIGIQAGANAFLGTLDNYHLTLRTNNTDRVTITNAGSMGIGTTSPSQTLSVEGNILASGVLTLTSTATSTFGGGINLTSGCFAVNGSCISGGGASTFLALTDTPNTYSAYRIPYTNAAATALTDSDTLVFTGTNLGIGTSSPFTTLSVAGSGYFAGTLTASSLIATTSITIPPTSTSTGQTLGVIYLNNTPFIHTYSDSEDGTENLFIGYSAGNFTTSGTRPKHRHRPRRPLAPTPPDTLQHRPGTPTPSRSNTTGY